MSGFFMTITHWEPFETHTKTYFLICWLLSAWVQESFSLCHSLILKQVQERDPTLFRRSILNECNSLEVLTNYCGLWDMCDICFFRLPTFVMNSKFRKGWIYIFWFYTFFSLYEINPQNLTKLGLERWLSCYEHWLL